MQTTTISTRVEELIAAASDKWPDVFLPDFRDNALKQLASHGGDERYQLYLVRESMLKQARISATACENCSLHTSRLCGSVFSDGTPNARVFVVGGGPGQFEQRTRVPFTHVPELNFSYCHLQCKNYAACFPEECLVAAQSLPILDRKRERISPAETARRLGEGVPRVNTVSEYFNAAIDGLFYRESWNAGRSMDQGKILSELYITDVTKCRKIDKKGDDDAPTMGQMRQCYAWLNIQLTIVQPTVVLLIGKSACMSALGVSEGEFKMKDHNGKFGRRHAGTMPNLPRSVTHVGAALHPSYISRVGNHSIDEQKEAFAGLRSVFEQAHAVIYGGN